MRGVAGAVVLLPVQIFNTGLKNDTYLLLWTVDQGWPQSFLPETYRVGTLRLGRLFAPFQIPLDAQNGEQAEVTVSIGSRGNLNLIQELTVTVIVGLGDRVLMPTVYGPTSTTSQPQTITTPPSDQVHTRLPVIDASQP